MVLVDTSSWVQALRPAGNPAAKARVMSLLVAGTAAWCHMVRVELWNGVGDSREKKQLREFEEELPVLPIDEAVWEEAVGIAIASRASGLTVPAADLVIFACARTHQVDLEYYDKHFDLLKDLA